MTEPKVQEASSPAELAQKVREALVAAATRASSLAPAEEAQSKEVAVQTDPSSINPPAESTQAQTQPLSEELEQLKKQLEEAKALAESRAQEARAADEKAKKLAVKAGQVDKFKALSNDLKEKLAALESSKATPMLSVKGGASGTPTPATFGVVGAAANGNTGNPSADAAPLVRGRGAPRGTQVARGRGAARGMARGINPRDILSRKSKSRRSRVPLTLLQRSNRHSARRIRRQTRCQSSGQRQETVRLRIVPATKQVNEQSSMISRADRVVGNNRCA